MESLKNGTSLLSAVVQNIDETQQKTDAVVQRLAEIESVLATVKKLYEEKEQLVLQLKETVPVGQEVVYGDYIFSVVDNFTEKNVVFRPAAVRRYDLDVDSVLARKLKEEKAVKKSKKMNNGWSEYINHSLTSGLLRWLVYKYENSDVCPKNKDEVFRAFKMTPLQNVKVVILGQDPYHTKDIADGLAFSSKKGIPPSLRNIFKAIELDLGIKNTESKLDRWARQGVLLLNTALTTEEGRPGAHLKEWDLFIKGVIDKLNKQERNVIFLLWGKKAQKYQYLIHKGHTTLLAAHPSPFSAKHFINCGHFSKVNSLLTKAGQDPIDWSTNERD